MTHSGRCIGQIVRDGGLDILHNGHGKPPDARPDGRHSGRPLLGYNHPMPHVIVDPESKSLQERPALIKSPRKSRKRFPEGCVTLMESESAALDGADESKNLHPAVVYGPSVSSESQRIYYLVRWL